MLNSSRFHGPTTHHGATRRVRRFTMALAIAACALGWASPSQTAVAAENSAMAAALDAISPEAMQQCVNLLADDAFEGREMGSRGGRAACAYLGGQLEKRHLKGAGDNGGLYQDFGRGSRNILAKLEGSGADQKSHYLILSAHYDHVGYGKPNNSFGPIGYIHKGADDNASGVAGLLAVIDAFNKLPDAPKRTILFAMWDGEEQGLLGSIYWLEHPTVPLDHVIGMVNMDMIGRLRKEKVEVYGTRTSPGLRRLICEQNDGGNLLLDFHWEMRGDSDHYPFYQKGIPALMFHTGLHSDYHRPSDTADKINPAGMREVAQLAFRTTLELANEEPATSFREHSREENIAVQTAFERPLPALPGRLGIRWNDDAEKGRGLGVVEVVPGSPAADAGLKPGDRIVRFAGNEFSGPAEFRSLVLSAANPVSIAVERTGSDQPVELTAQLTGTPIRVGVTWQTDEAEPRSVVLLRVTPDSPADRAGLKVDDRIYQVDGKDFASSKEFDRLLEEEPTPLELTVETRGQMHRVKLESDRQALSRKKGTFGHLEFPLLSSSLASRLRPGPPSRPQQPDYQYGQECAADAPLTGLPQSGPCRRRIK